MKKNLMKLLATVMVFSLCACSSKPAQSETLVDPQPPVTTEMQTEAQTEAPATEAPTTEAPATEAPATEQPTEAPKTAADYPGPAEVTIVNPRGDNAAVTKQDDGTYKDADGNVYTYDGNEAWVDANGTEWNEAFGEAPATEAPATEAPATEKATEAKKTAADYPGPAELTIVNPRGDNVDVTKQDDGTYKDADGNVYTFDGEYGWFDADGMEWNEAL